MAKGRRKRKSRRVSGKVYYRQQAALYFSQKRRRQGPH